MTYSKTKVVSSNFKLEEALAYKIAEEIDTPRALTVKIMLDSKDYQGILDLEVNPEHYDDYQAYADDRLVTSVLSKSKNLPVDIDRRQKAIDAFFTAEEQCRRTNESLFNIPHYSDVFFNVRRNVERIIGTLDEKVLFDIQDEFRHGTGATTGLKAVGNVGSSKYDEPLHLTENLYPFYKAIIGERWHDYATRSPEIVSGNKFTTVPKSAKTDRGICVEPTLNVYIQLGIGKVLKSLLARAKINLYSQDRNRYLASQAYKLKLATIDLSMASDTLSLATVYRLLPRRWFELLDLARSQYTEIGDGDPTPLEKFSSMGNGFTFELETLIFVAICKSIVPKQEHHHVSVYGDDIIVPQAYANDVVESLKFFGFSVNGSKSFLAGNFFESCGTDWFQGHPVRPFFFRKEEGSDIPFPLSVANSIREYASQHTDGHYCDIRWKPLWEFAVKQIPQPWRHCCVPPSYGDTGLHVDSSQAPVIPLRYGHEGRAVRHIVMQPIQKRSTRFGRLLLALATRPVPSVQKYPLRDINIELYGIRTDSRLRELCDLQESLFSRGREPVRGYLGKPRTKVGVTTAPFSPSWM